MALRPCYRVTRISPGLLPYPAERRAPLLIFLSCAHPSDASVMKIGVAKRCETAGTGQTKGRIRSAEGAAKQKTVAEAMLQRSSGEVSATSDARARLPGRCCSDSVFCSET